MTEPSADFMFAPHARVVVYRLPEKLIEGYCFGVGVPITFVNVDWFDMPTSESRETLEKFIRRKRYAASPADRFLVLCEEHPDFTFTIGN